MLAAVFHDTVLVDPCSNLTPVTSVTTFKNWWQLGFHPKFAIDTLSFYSVSSASALRCEIGNQEDSTLVHCAGNTVQFLQRCQLRLSWTPTAPSWTHWLQDLGSHTAAWVWVVKSKRLKKSSSDWLNSGNPLIQRLSENAIFVFLRFCQVVQKHKLFEVT